MSMLPSQHLFDVPITVLRREKVGEEDGTPIYEVDPEGVEWPEGVSNLAAVDYQEDVMTVTSPNKIGSVTTVKALLTMEPTAYDVLDEDDTLSFDGHDNWRVNSLNRPRGLWGAHHTQVTCSRQVNV